MFCSKCGHQNSDDANFCQKCGTNFRAVTPSPQSKTQTQYETVEIEAREAGIYVKTSLVRNLMGAPLTHKCQFVARHVTPMGEDIATVGEFPKVANVPIEQVSGVDRQFAQEELDRINNNLIKAGWDPIERGRFWYSYRYRLPWEGGQHVPLLKEAEVPSTPATKRMGCTAMVLWTIFMFVVFFAVSQIPSIWSHSDLAIGLLITVILVWFLGLFIRR